MILRWFFFFCIIILCNWYSSLAIKTVTKSPGLYYTYLALNFIIIANFIVQIKTNNNTGLMTPFFSYSLGFFIISIILQSTIILFLFIEDFSRLLIWLYRVLFKGTSDTFNYVPQRRLFLSQLSILLASIPASALFIGMLRGKYNYKVIKHQLSFDRLPSYKH